MRRQLRFQAVSQGSVHSPNHPPLNLWTTRRTRPYGRDKDHHRQNEDRSPPHIDSNDRSRILTLAPPIQSTRRPVLAAAKRHGPISSHCYSRDVDPSRTPFRNQVQARLLHSSIEHLSVIARRPRGSYVRRDGIGAVTLPRHRSGAGHARAQRATNLLDVAGSDLGRRAAAADAAVVRQVNCATSPRPSERWRSGSPMARRPPRLPWPPSRLSGQRLAKMLSTT